MKRIGLVGITGYGGLLLEALQQELKAGDARLSAVTVINQDEVQETCAELKKGGCQIYGEYRSMLEDWKNKLDLCIIPTGIHMHREMAVAALRSGMNIHVEKPLAGTVKEGLKIVRAAEEEKRFAAIGFQDMYVPSVWSIRRFLDSGGVGDLKSIRMTGCWPRQESYYTRNNWAGRVFCDGLPVYDSPLNNAFAHMVNLGLWLASPRRDAPDAMEPVRGALLRFYPIETYDSCAMVLRGESGVEMECLLTHAGSEAREPMMTILGEKGEVLWNYGKTAEARNERGELLQTWKLMEGVEVRRQMFRQVMGCIGTEEKPLYPIHAGLAHVRTMENLHRRAPVGNAGDLIPWVSNRRNTPWSPVPEILDHLQGWLEKQREGTSTIQGTPLPFA